MDKISNLMKTLKEHMKALEKILESQKNRLCEKESCPQELECASSPERRCSKYKKKRICIEEEVYCLESTDSCTEEVEECLNWDKVCKNFAADGV